eukprot:898767-Prymnesium_polylepis.1
MFRAGVYQQSSPLVAHAARLRHETIVLCVMRRDTHLWRLQHIAIGAIEQGKMKGHGQVNIAKIERNVLRAREPARKGRKVFSRKSKTTVHTGIPTAVNR